MYVLVYIYVLKFLLGDFFESFRQKGFSFTKFDAAIIMTGFLVSAMIRKIIFKLFKKFSSYVAECD